MKLRTQVIIIFILVILITGLSVNIANQIISKKILKEQIRLDIESTAKSRALHIETYLKTEKNLVLELSESIVIERLLKLNKESKDYNEKLQDVLKRLKNSAEINGIYDIFVLDTNGVVVASNIEERIGLSRIEDPYFINGKKGVYLKIPYNSRFFKDQCSLAFSAPIFQDITDKLLGVLVIRFRLDYLNEITTEPIGLGETGEIYLLNKDGYMISSSRFLNDTFLKQKVDTPESRECWELFGEEEEEEREEVDIYLSYWGEKVVGTHYRIKGTNWCLIAEMSFKEALAPIDRLINTNILIVAVLLILSIIISPILSGSITKPIKKLHKGADAIVSGNLDFKVGTDSKDELGQLSRAFDEMTQKLKISNRQLEKQSENLEEQIEERTKKLEKIIEESQQQRIASMNTLNDLDQTNQDLISEMKERKQAEEELIKSEEKYRSLVETIEEGIGNVDENEAFVFVNQAAADIFGYSKDEMIGKNLKELTSPEMFQKILEETSRRKKGESNSYELSVLRKNQEQRIITVIATPIITKDGKHKGSFGIFHDITERKQAEEQIKRDLEEKETLLRELYHRTKNNMQVIPSMLTMQSSRSGNEFVHNSFKEIDDRIIAMALVHEKLYQAKDLSQINLKEYIIALFDLIKGSHGIESEVIALKLDLEDVPVLIDTAIPCGLIMNELISNVFKHAFPNNEQGEIHIRLYKDEEEAINIYLADNGIGVSPDFDLRNCNSMGLQIMFDLVEYQLQGEVNYVTKNGLKWHIKLKDDLHTKRV